MRACPGCGTVLERAGGACPRCGEPAGVPARAGRRHFLVFAAAMALAAAGGGLVVVRARRAVASRRGHPDTISPSDRERARALLREAEGLRAAGDPDGAVARCLAAERADPGLAAVQRELARAYEAKGDAPRAAERYRRYLATGPEDAEAVRAALDALGR